MVRRGLGERLQGQERNDQKYWTHTENLWLCQVRKANPMKDDRQIVIFMQGRGKRRES